MTNLNVTDAANSSEIRLHMGDELTVRLESIPGTGYSWEVSRDTGEVLSQLDEPVYEKVQQPKLGGVQLQVFRFRAQLSGVHRLRLEYRRPWDKTGPGKKVFSITVIVN